MARTGHEAELDGAPPKDPGCSPENSLWLAVVQEVISNEPEHCARQWLHSEDGQMVTAMAGVDAEWVADRILPAASRQASRGTRRRARHPVRPDLSPGAALIAARAARHEFFRSVGWIS